MTKIPRTAGTDLAWRQGNTANMIGNPSSANPYEPQLSNDAYRAWNQGYHGHPYDERGGFARKEDS
jgi:hypothetical protein